MQVDIEIQDELGIVKMKSSENQHYSARKLAYMAINDISGWGWFLVLSIITAFGIEQETGPDKTKSK